MDANHPISLSSLISAPTQPQLQAQIDALPCLSRDASRCLIGGLPRSGKTSMLFHMSCKAAAQGRTVVWLCSQARMEQSAPLLPSGVHRSNPILSSIAFKYISDLSGVKRYGSCLHLLDGAPDVLIVDDLSELMNATRLEAGRSTRDAEVTKALALLVDALDHLKEATGHVCQLFVSDTAAEEGPRSLYLLSRWFHAVISLAGTPPVSLTLHVTPGSAQYVPPQLAKARLHYSVTHSGVNAEGIAFV